MMDNKAVTRNMVDHVKQEIKPVANQLELQELPAEQGKKVATNKKAKTRLYKKGCLSLSYEDITSLLFVYCF